MNTKSILVFSCTYNEADTVSTLVKGIASAVPTADILIVDDSSTDGTSDILSHLSAKFPRLRILTRPRKLGIGSAHHLAMQYALKNDYDILVTMDADLSHDPAMIPSIIKRLEDHDFVIGSRYTEGGSCDYRGVRQAISVFGNFLARKILGLKFKESTTSFRAFPKKLLEQLLEKQRFPHDYAYFFSVTHFVQQFTNKIAEVPIHFSDRRFGRSKISSAAVFNSALTLLSLFFRVKRRTAKEDTKRLQACTLCRQSFFELVYPARKSAGEPTGFQCTATGHSSHGPIWDCLTCGLRQINPRPSSNDLATLYSDVEDSVYLQHIEAREDTFRYNLTKVKQYLSPDALMLDIGAYCGAFVHIAKEQGYKIEGLEPSAWACAAAKDKYQLDIRQGTIASLKSKTQLYDVITSWDVLEHLGDPVSDLQIINGALKEDGIFLFSTLMIDNWFPRLMGRHWPWYMDMHLFYFTLNTLQDTLNKAGFAMSFSIPYTHIIKGRYLARKLRALGVPLAGHIEQSKIQLLDKITVPFSFGDIALCGATKIVHSADVNSTE